MHILYMVWRRKEKTAVGVAYERLSASSVEEELGGRSSSSNSSCKAMVRRGYVPVLVGESKGATQRFEVHVKVFRNPSMAALLDMGAQEFGSSHQHGPLRIPCDVAHFRRLMASISTCKTR